MSEIKPPEPVSESSKSQPSASDPTTAGAAASSNPATFKDSKINSLEDLRTKAPQVYHQMELGLATSICSQMKRSQERLKKAWRQGYQR